MCLICACDAGPSAQPSNTSSASFLTFIVPPSDLEMQPELLRNSKTDVPPYGHKGRARGMRDVPIHAEPNVQAGTHPNEGGESSKQRVAPAAFLGESRDAIVLRMQPGQLRANEPFPRDILGLVGTIRKPESRLEITTQARRLCSCRAHQYVEVFIRDEPPHIKES